MAPINRMDLRNKTWNDLTEVEKASLHPDIREIMEKYPEAKIVSSASEP